MFHHAPRTCSQFRHGLVTTGAALLLLITPGAALKAQVSSYSSLSAWLAAVSSPGLDTFNDLSSDPNNTPPSLSRSAGTYSYVARATEGLFVVGPAGDSWLSTNTASDALQLDSFTSTVRGIGGFFFGTDIDGAVVSTGTLRVSWSTSAGNGFLDLVNPSTSTFFGLVANGSLTSLSVRDLTPDDDALFWPTANNLRLAALPPAATVVPEPSTYALVGTALGMLALVRRRKRV